MFIADHLWDEGVSTLKTPGFVYFIQADLAGNIKIGWATDPEKRRATLERMSPLPLTLLHSEPGTGRDERELHDKFKHLRRHGEWFSPGPDLQTYIINRAGRDPFYRKRRIAL